MNGMPGPHGLRRGLTAGVYMRGDKKQKGKAVTLSEQRAIVAMGIMGYELVVYDPKIDAKLGPPFLPCYRRPNGLVLFDVLHYHPDLEDDRSLGQRERLKARLRELKIQYEINWGYPPRENILFRCSLLPTNLFTCCNGESTISEGAALLEACAKLAKEMKQ